MRKYLFIICFILFFSNAQSQKIDELTIVNESLDSTYDLRTRFHIIEPPYFKCCDNDTLRGAKRKACCDQSGIPEEFRVNYYGCINRETFDTLDQLMIIDDTAFVFDLKDEKKYILERLGKDSKFYDFVKDFKRKVSAKKNNVESIHQGKIRFLSKSTFDIEKRTYSFGRSGKQMLLGHFRISRIYIDKNKAIAMYRMSWLGGVLCGYDNLVFLSLQSGVWKDERKIMTGVY